MRQFAVRLAVVLAVLQGLAGIALATLALSEARSDSSPPRSSPAQSAPFTPAAGQPRFDRATQGRDDAGSPRPTMARTSIATRHVPTPAESALTGALHPATDRVMVIIIGWVLLALVGGGLLAGRGRRARPGAWSLPDRSWTGSRTRS